MDDNNSSQRVLRFGLMSLPTELLEDIASRLRESKDLMCLSLTCKIFHAMMMGNVAVWRSQAKKLGYAKGIIMPTMNLLSKAYLVLWVVESKRNRKPFRPIPIVGIIYNVIDPVELRDIGLPPRILKEFKSRLNAITTSPYPHYTKKKGEIWGEFKTMTSLSDQEILKRACSRWAIGPLGINHRCSHLVILEYVIQHCFSAKILPAEIPSLRDSTASQGTCKICDGPVPRFALVKCKSNIYHQSCAYLAGLEPLLKHKILLAFEVGICGMAMSALLAELKCRAYHIGLNLSIEDTFGDLIKLFPSVSKRGKRIAILELRKQYVAIDATGNPWRLCKLLVPPPAPFFP